MFTEVIHVRRLKEDHVTLQVVKGINQLLKKQRRDAQEITEDSLLEKMKKMAVVIGWNDSDEVVGLGVITLSGGLNFDCCEIRHFVIADGFDFLSIGMRIVAELLQVYFHTSEYIDAGAWVQDEEMKRIFIAMGFKEKPGSRFRLRFHKR